MNIPFVPLVDPHLEDLYRRSLVAGEYWACTGEKLEQAREMQDCFVQALNARLAEADRLDALINNPHTDNFLEAVRLEAAHQRERWGTEGDAGKTDADWLWLLGYLVGKAVHKPEKQLHHIITTAAACLNWHAMRSGVDSTMRPGIDPPERYREALKKLVAALESEPDIMMLGEYKDAKVVLGPSAPREYNDELSRAVWLGDPPRRSIVSDDGTGL